MTQSRKSEQEEDPTALVKRAIQDPFSKQGKNSNSGSTQEKGRFMVVEKEPKRGEIHVNEKIAELREKERNRPDRTGRRK